MKTPTETLIESLRILAVDIQSDDGVANAAIAESALRLEELNDEVEDWRNSARMASSENCPPDEVHCTCVGVLRKTLKDRDAEISRLTTRLAEQKLSLINVLTTVRSDIVLIAELGYEASPHQTIVQIDDAITKFSGN